MVRLAARLGWAGVLGLRPGTALALDGSAGDDRAGRALCRVLAGRHVLQGTLEALHRSSGPRRIGTSGVVDGVHSSSMAGFAVLDPRHRRFAVLEVGTAAAFVALDIWCARRA